MPKWLPLMRTGSFRDRFGKMYTVTTDVLKRIADNYNPANPAQLVVGHPGKNTVPSFGIVDKLKAVGDRLLFVPGNVVAEFAALVKKGGFPDISAGLDTGLTGLRHVAFLSAERPAIDGLEPICEFSAPQTGDAGVQLMVTGVFNGAEFSVDDNWLKWRMREIGQAFRRLRENIVEKDGIENADKILPGYIVDSLSEDPPKTNDTNISEFSSNEGGSMEYQKLYEAEVAKTADLTAKVNDLTTKVAEFSASLATLTAEKTALAKTVADTEAAAAKAEFSAFVEKLITDKKALPAEKDALVDTMMKMRTASGAEFSAETSPLKLFRAELERRAVTVPGGTHTADNRGAEFSAGSGADDLVSRATAYQKLQANAGITVTNAEAIRHVAGN